MLIFLSSFKDAMAHQDLFLPQDLISANTIAACTAETWLHPTPPCNLSPHIPSCPRSGPSLVSLPPASSLLPICHIAPQRALSGMYICSYHSLIPPEDLFYFLFSTRHSSSFSHTPLFSKTLPPNSSLYTSMFFSCCFFSALPSFSLLHWQISLTKSSSSPRESHDSSSQLGLIMMYKS